MEIGKSRKRPFWVYLLPLLHLGACLISMVGHLVPSLQYLGIVWVGVMLVDLPVSAVAYASAWWSATVTVIWVVVVGTLWWYLLSRGAELLIDRFRAKAQPNGHVRNTGNF